MRIQPIRTEAGYDAAVARVAHLIGAKPGTEAADELEVLATLVDVYESKRFPMDTPDPVTIIQFQMEQQGLTRKDLEPMIGSRARVSEVMNGKRSLTLAMMRRLRAGLGIPVDLLVGPLPGSRTPSARRKRKSSAADVRAAQPAAAPPNRSMLNRSMPNPPTLNRSALNRSALNRSAVNRLRPNRPHLDRD